MPNSRFAVATYSILDVLIIGTLALGEILMAPLAPLIIASIFATAVRLALMMDQVKVWLFAHYKMIQSGAPDQCSAKCQKGQLELASNNLHERVAGDIAVSGRARVLVRNDGLRCFIKTQQFPAGGFAATDTAANLPSSHNGVVVFGKADIVNLDKTRISVIAKLKDMT